MYQFQVDNMEARWFLLYVICQTIITESLGGVTLPFPDFVGKVTPLKPKPLSPSSISPTIYQDTIPKLCPSALGGSPFPEFSSPLAFTSSSRALPVPKIDSMSIADVKMPERLREKFQAKLNKVSRKANPIICPPEVSSYKCPLLSLPSQVPVSPVYTSSDIYQPCLNKLLPLPNIQVLPTVPVDSLPLPLTLESRQPSFLEQYSTNTLFPSISSYSLPYPLYYKSMYLPGVRTPDMLPINYKPIPSIESINLNYPSQSYAQNLLNSVPSDILRHQNMIQIPKPSSNVPFLIKPVSSSPNAALPNLWSSLEPISSSTPLQLPFRGKFDPHESLLSDLKNDEDLKSLLNSLSCTLVDKISDYKRKPLSSPKISSAARVPSVYPVMCTQNVPEICSRPLIPAITSNRYPLLSPISNTLKYSPPIIPCDPIPNISSVTSNFSPSIYCPSKLLQTPITPSISCINQPSCIAESTSKMLFPINDLVSNIAQCILSSYKTCTDSAVQNVLQRARCTLPSNPYADTAMKIEPIPSVVTLPQVNPVNVPSISPIIQSVDCISLPVVDTSTDLLFDASYIPSTFEMSTCHPISIPSPQSIAGPVSSLVSFSSPQLCPSNLPSPTLSAYPSIASPFYMEAPVYKVSSSKKDSKVEKLIEMMLIAEILNNDESFDWDDLDTLLALLSVS